MLETKYNHLKVEEGKYKFWLDIDKYELGRDVFLKEAWLWKEKYSNNILDQWARLGLSLGYLKEIFTLDKGLNETVKFVFAELYKKGGGWLMNIINQLFIQRKEVNI